MQNEAGSTDCTYRLLHSGVLIGLLSDAEVLDDNFPQIVSRLPRVYIMTHTRKDRTLYKIGVT